MTLKILVGPPGVGKTRYCREHMGPGDVRVSMDDIVTMLGAGYDYREELKPLYRKIEEGIIYSAKASGHDVWLDRTNMDVKRRGRYVKLARSVSMATVLEVLNFMPAVETLQDPAGWLLQRRLVGGDRGVGRNQWNDVIRGMLAKYEPPTLDEGFSLITTIMPVELLMGAVHA